MENNVIATNLNIMNSKDKSGLEALLLNIENGNVSSLDFYHNSDGAIEGLIKSGERVETSKIYSSLIVSQKDMKYRLGGLVYDPRTSSNGKINLWLSIQRYNIQKGFSEKTSKPLAKERDFP